MLDLTVASIPIYFGTMAAEHRYLRARAAEQGPGPADYTPQDTATSLAMGLGSLAIPLVLPKLVRHVVPGKGRYGKVLVGVAAAAAVATTVADRLVERADRSDDEAAPTTRQRLGRLARRARRVTGPVAVGAGALAVTTSFAARTNADEQWAAGGADRDRGTGPLPWFVAIAGWDFLYYWNHRFMHEVRALWAIHVVHHSSERYNLSTALRQPVADVLGLWLPYGVMARFGIRPHLLTQARALNLLYQYWVHTETIRTLGTAEEVLNTPSHHRVHHGSQRQYLDRNHGSILIVWDRLFGTFEREDERVVYGLTTNIETYNPVKVATHEYRDIVRDVAGSTSWRDRLGFVLRGPGWAHERHRQLAAEGDAIVDDPDEAVTAA
ncbi:sterol desaturase family protein [Acidimicrobiia bacterium EGI L10123]|uniref:sterol desaturase family protein n=1 Tax=Salinilacustrithrix flava TaxID=2957203 RepID=UPI003D7C20F9|nr:sterol desaturase family protein [Acidimicrobiia bacterium EGI L10123]